MDGFKELTRQDAVKGLTHELEFLSAGIPENMVKEKQRFGQQMQAFLGLFKRYIETTKDIDWEKISLLPDNDVSFQYPQSAYDV